MLHTPQQVINLAIRTIFRDHELRTLDPLELGPLAEAQSAKVGLAAAAGEGVEGSSAHFEILCGFVFAF